MAADVAVYGFITSLYVDMVGSTSRLLALREFERARFYRALVRQIEPHITALGLESCVAKFTGDGWLILAHDPSEVEGLLCLGLILAKRFRAEMAALTGLAPSDVPALRVAAGFGRDLQITTPRGHLDWVGDSARRAARLADCCLDDEFLVSRQLVDSSHLDFVFDPVDLATRPGNKRPKHAEEPLAALRLTGIAAVAPTASDVPHAYVYTLGVLGDYASAERVAFEATTTIALEVIDSTGPTESPDQSVEERRESLYQLIRAVPDSASALRLFESLPDTIRRTTEAFNALLKRSNDWWSLQKHLEMMRREGVQPDVVTYTLMMHVARNYEQALEVFRALERSQLQPDVYLFTNLVSKAPTYTIAREWLDKMRAAGITPNVITWTALMSKATDYRVARKVLREMKSHQVEPNEYAYSILVRRAPNYARAIECLRESQRAGYLPDAVTYTALMTKAPAYVDAVRWFDAMKRAGLIPDVVSYSILTSRAPDYATARKWLDEMYEDGITPNAYIFSALASRASTFAIARLLLEEMERRDMPLTTYVCNGVILRSESYEEASEVTNIMARRGVPFDHTTYSLMIQRAPSREIALELVEMLKGAGLYLPEEACKSIFRRFSPEWPATELLSWFWSLPTKPKTAWLDVAVEAYRDTDRIRDALFIALHYPHLDAATQLIRERASDALEFFAHAVNEGHPDGEYALGVARTHAGMIEDARTSLLVALSTTTIPKRQKHIAELLGRLAARTAGPVPA